MAPVKLDSPIKVFVAFVVMDSVEITASLKLNSTNGVSFTNPLGLVELYIHSGETVFLFR